MVSSSSISTLDDGQDGVGAKKLTGVVGVPGQKRRGGGNGGGGNDDRGGKSSRVHDVSTPSRESTGSPLLCPPNHPEPGSLT